MAGATQCKPNLELTKFMRAFDLFKECGTDFLEQLSSVTHLRIAEKSTLILNEGEVNNRLMLLLSGRVDVRVEGESITILDTPGDLMGEISALTGRAVTASLHALSDVQFLSAEKIDLDQLVEADTEGFGHRLYYVLASVLSDKVARTNDKARRFEVTNRKLLEVLQSLKEMNQTLDQKVRDRTIDLERKSGELKSSYIILETRNAEIVASHRKLEELYSTKDLTFRRLSELQESLTPLLGALAELEKATAPSERTRLERAKSQLETSIDMMRPLSELYSTEQAIRSRRVLLGESNKKQQMIARLALGGTGVQLDIVSTSEEALAAIEAGARYDIVFLSSDLATLIPELKQRLPAAKLVFMVSSNVPAEIPVLQKYAAQISNIVSRHPEDRTFTVKNVATTVSKLISKDIFGLEKYLIWGVETQTRSVVGSNERRQLIEEMKDYFSSLGVRSSISDRAAMVSEELLMNAIYDAPMSPEGKSLYNHLPRTSTVDLQKREYSEFKFACDGMLAAISITDPFGGFRIDTLLSYLERNYSQSLGDNLAKGKGGAGRGLHLIIENSDLVVFNVKRSLKTEVIAFFNLDPRSKDEGITPSFHFFVE